MDDESTAVTGDDRSLSTLLEIEMGNLLENNQAAADVIRTAVEDGWFEEHQTARTIDRLVSAVVQACTSGEGDEQDED